MSIKFTILGCGHSGGTPTIGNYWGNCDPNNPKNRRTRTSAMVQSDSTTIVIDTGPDFRYQANDCGIENIDAVLYTHAHSDHISGIDELRVLRLRYKQVIDIYGNNECIETLQRRFNYLFEQQFVYYPVVLEPHIYADDDYGAVQTVRNINYVPFEQDHGTCTSLGFRFADLAYSTDIVSFSEKTLKTLSGIKTWIIDSAGYKMDKNAVHLTLRDIYKYNEIVQAEHVYLTHLSHLMDYDTLCKELPDGYYPAYDGLTFDLKDS